MIYVNRLSGCLVEIKAIAALRGVAAVDSGTVGLGTTNTLLRPLIIHCSAILHWMSELVAQITLGKIYPFSKSVPVKLIVDLEFVFGLGQGLVSNRCCLYKDNRVAIFPCWSETSHCQTFTL